jgi:CMP-N,N'-diacetyllegionaminic acid synthase
LDQREQRQPSSRPGFVALVPARGHSKGIYLKNRREVGGVPLLARAIRRADACRHVARVIVSTDCDDLAGIALEEGAEVPFLRPPALAEDDTPMWKVIEHAWKYIQEREILERPPEGIVLLQPTSPFVRPETIDRAIEVFRTSGAPLLKAVRKVREHPNWMLTPKDGFLVPYEKCRSTYRQELSDVFVLCGAIYVYGRAYLGQPDAQAPISWIELSWPEGLDLDEPEDLLVAQCLALFGYGEGVGEVTGR